jgi:hypothetical protein
MKKELVILIIAITVTASLLAYSKHLSISKSTNSDSIKRSKVDVDFKAKKEAEVEYTPPSIIPEEKIIPRKIFQLVTDKNNIPLEFNDNIKYVKEMNPGWEYKLYDNNDQIEYITANFPENVVNAYKMLNPKYGAALADFFRYLLMYIEGGVYLDIKSASRYPLDKIISKDDEFILSHWDKASPHEDVLKKYGEFQQWHIICKPRHPAIKAVIDNVTRNINNYNIAHHGSGKPAVLKVTGPIAYTLAILPLISKYKFRISRSHVDLGLIYNNIHKDHTKIFGKNHYSLQTEPLTIKEKDIKLNPICDSREHFKEQGKCSVAIEIVPLCTNVLEFRTGSSDRTSSIINGFMYNRNNHIVIDAKTDKTYPGEYKVIKKGIEQISLEDIIGISPIDCLISDCNSCLLGFLRSSLGKSVLDSLKTVIVEIIDENNNELEKILTEYDIVHTNTGYGCGISCSTNVYVKI